MMSSLAPPPAPTLIYTAHYWPAATQGGLVDCLLGKEVLEGRLAEYIQEDHYGTEVLNNIIGYSERVTGSVQFWEGVCFTLARTTKFITDFNNTLYKPSNPHFTLNIALIRTQTHQFKQLTVKVNKMGLLCSYTWSHLEGSLHRVALNKT